MKPRRDLYTVNDPNIMTEELKMVQQSLQQCFIINESTAAAILTVLLQQKLPDSWSQFMVANLPKLISYYLAKLQNGDILYRSTSATGVGLLKPSYGYGIHSSQHPDDDINIVMDRHFIDFYHNTLCHIVNDKLEIIVNSMQALAEQVGILDYAKTYALLQNLTESGMKQIIDFSWSTKARRISEVLAGKSVPSIVNPKFDQIPADLQLKLAQPDNKIDILVAANDALAEIFMHDLETRRKILQNLFMPQLANFPRLARVYRDTALYLSQTPWITNEASSSFRISLMYGSITTPNLAKELDWARSEVMYSYPPEISDLIISSTFVERILSKLPKQHCIGDKGTCFEIMQLPENIKQLNLSLSALEQNQTMPEVSFINHPPLNTWVQTIPEQNCFPTQAVVSVLLATGITTGVAYIGYSIYQQFSFFSKSLNGKKSKPSAMTDKDEIAYLLVEADSPTLRLKHY